MTRSLVLAAVVLLSACGSERAGRDEPASYKS